jgi:hypothetical protein
VAVAEIGQADLELVAAAAVARLRTSVAAADLALLDRVITEEQPQVIQVMETNILAQVVAVAQAPPVVMEQLVGGVLTRQVMAMEALAKPMLS